MNNITQTPETGAGPLSSPAQESTPLTRKEFRQESEPDLITKQEFAKRISVSIRSVEKMLAEKAIPHLRLGRKIVRIPWNEAREHLRRKFTINAL